MPIKHQASSYRTRNGLRYENDGDVFGLTVEEIKNNAKMRVMELRAEGRKAFYEIHNGEYGRVFATGAA